MGYRIRGKGIGELYHLSTVLFEKPARQKSNPDSRAVPAPGLQAIFQHLVAEYIRLY